MKYAAGQQDLDNLEAMRADSSVPDHIYKSAAIRFGVTPKPRSSQKQVGYVSLADQNAATVAWVAQHQELKDGGHWNYNTSLIRRWLDDEQVPATQANLDSAYRELSEHEMFRDRTAGKRGGKIVRVYDIELLRADRNKSQSPVGTFDSREDVKASARYQVSQANPELNPKSDQFQKLVDAVIAKQARAHNKPAQRMWDGRI